MKERFNLSQWAINHRELVWYLMIMLTIAGIMSYKRLGRNEDPVFSIKTMLIQAKWPGATIDETMNQITERLEKKLQETPNIDFVRSFTTPGSSTIFVNLKGSTPAAKVPDCWYQVRKKINDIAVTLPQGVVGPFFNDEFGDTYGIIYAFTADGFSGRELTDYIEDIRSKLLQIADVSKIEILGNQDEKVYLEFSTRRLAGLGLKPMEFIQMLQAQNSVKPAGVVQTENETILLRVSGGFQSEADLREVNININGKLFPLSDIVTIKRDYIDPPQTLFKFNGKAAIGLAISMTAGGDILALGENVKEAMQSITADLPIGIEHQLVANQPTVVEENIAEFMKALEEAFMIVLFVSFLSLGLRAGAVVACSIPLVLAIVFLVMELMSIDLQRISLGALIIALGLLVDDAMITVEMMIMKLEEGWDKVRAATFSYTSTAFPMLTGTLVTVVGFIPIGFSRSSAGEYVFSLFAVIGIALIASWFVAVVFTPIIGLVILPDKLQHHDQQQSKLSQFFRTILLLAMRAPKRTIGITVALFIISIASMKYIPQQFFPSSDRPELLVNMQLPQNSSIFATTAEVAKLEQLLENNPDIVRWSSYIGRGAIRFYLPLDAAQPNPSFAQTVVVTKNIEARERVRSYLQKEFKEKFAAINSRIMPLEMGPPIGWPLQYRVSGHDLEQVRDIAYRLAEIIGSESQVQDINFDWIEPARVLRIKVDQNQAKLLGISSENLAAALNAVVSGMKITQIRDSIYLIDVVIRAEASQRVSLDSLSTLQISTSSGRKVPLMQVAKVEYEQEYPLIWRRDRLPTITVQADTTAAVLPATVVKRLQPKILELNAQLPAGYHIKTGGSTEESAKSQAAVAAVVPLMTIIMVTLLMIQLQSIQRVILVLSVVPLGLIGVVAILLIANKPLGFVAILGIIALIGMIIRNSVIIIDQIETEIAHGLPHWDAVVAATMHRFRPVILTAAAAILGMIPIAPTVFWGPMAYAIMGGLAVATILTLVFLPALYCAWFKVVE
ncbi:efflux RND transporter permease subunit [Candidatus Trichorickettsia mobilis]|uniref:efflux RND transporter permease subunit n=1 Tax=Candidatus Trichorickettsia mobilis TaxID=1346319 RepID=UPI00292CE52C|nr:efflux RND transporter permease subunit [Candidatus Trichorickettsia mobilis]